MPINHPAAITENVTPAANRVPIRAQLAWSAEREKRLRILADGCALLVISANITGLAWLSGIHEFEFLIISGAALGFVLAKINAKSRSMLSNKPVACNVREMTVWIRWDNLPGATWFKCACGNVHRWADAEVFPKPAVRMRRGTLAGDLAGYPAGQARQSVVCGCGRGHYRLIS